MISFKEIIDNWNVVNNQKSSRNMQETIIMTVHNSIAIDLLPKLKYIPPPMDLKSALNNRK
jgi:hypothetical protein